MPNIVISDTSCLIVLEKIGELSLLQKIYQEVITTPEIATEYNRELPSWIKIISAKNKSIQRELEKQIDLGEASAIALGLEISNCSIILDDLKARKVAEILNLEFTGTLGIIVKAKHLNIVNSVKPIVQRIKEAGLRFSEAVEKDILRQANE
jgi:predicted nucleic acid-binding protein